jgi:hypothetical protein
VALLLEVAALEWKVSNGSGYIGCLIVSMCSFLTLHEESELSSQHQSESFGSSTDVKEPLDDESEDIYDGIVWQGLFGPIILNESKNS